MKYFVISQDGMHQYKTREIVNSENLFSTLEKKQKNPHWHLSVNENGSLDVNPATPLYIYGAISANIIVDENKTIIYSTWTGEHKQAIETKYLLNFTQK